MADLLDRQHADALLSLLRADTGPPALVVYPDINGFTDRAPARPYVRVYVTIERPPEGGGNALTGFSQQWVTRWFCHCVGDNEYAATAVAMRVRAAALNQRPTIAGRDCGFIKEEQAAPPVRDEETDTTVFDALVVYRMVSV